MNKLNLQPISGTQNRVFVELIEVTEKVLASGIVLPTSFQQKNGDGTAFTENKPETEAYVVAVSEVDFEGAKPFVKVGDKVMISDYGGVEREIDNKTYRILRESDIFAIIPQ